MNRRNSFEIAMDILISINEGNNRITRIMYDTNTSHVPLITNLAVLEERGFIRFVADNDKDTRLRYKYWITPLGIELINAYKALLRMWNKTFIE